MKITIEEPQAGAEDEIIVRCHNISPELLNMLDTFKASSKMLVASIDNELHKINPSDIYYIEAVDRKVFLYCESEVYESKQKLYELEELAMNGFVRISKSAIVNMYKIKTFLPSLSGNAEAVLINKERIAISRRYVSGFKKNLMLKVGGQHHGY